METLDGLVLLGEAIDCDTRIRIWMFVLETDGVTLSQIATAFNIAVSTAYHHVRRLRRAGLVVRYPQRRGAPTVLRGRHDRWRAMTIVLGNDPMHLVGREHSSTVPTLLRAFECERT